MVHAKYILKTMVQKKETEIKLLLCMDSTLEFLLSSSTPYSFSLVVRQNRDSSYCCPQLTSEIQARLASLLYKFIQQSSPGIFVFTMVHLPRYQFDNICNP